MPENQENGVISQTPHRPKIVSHHSNSLPSTPRPHARDPLLEVRASSPRGLGVAHSPRSVSSESQRTMPSLRTVAPTCRFMSTQTSRRRIPYTIGTDLLGPDKEEPKPALDPHQKKKLTADMRELYDRLLPSETSHINREEVAVKLKKILVEEWPEKEIHVSVFGSSGNLLYTTKSDVDICITVTGLETVCVLAEVLAKRGMQKVTCVHAKAVPIVKIWDPELQLACDLNVNNHVAIKNTRMVRAYMEMDERVRPLAMIVKYWTKRRVINEASGGTLSSYTWTLLLIHFLQTRDPPLLPVLPLRDSENQHKNDFSADLEELRGFSASNKETLGELLFFFFRRYGHEIDFESVVVSVRTGTLLSKEEKRWHRATNNRLCVEEPFNTDRNLGNTADDTAFRGLHLELRQAFKRISEDKDIESSVCEPFEFPPDEPKTVFERPQPQPKPVLSRSHSQSGRGGRGPGGSRGGKNHHHQSKNASGNRRASSAAAYGHSSANGAYPFLPNPQFLVPEQLLRIRHSQQAHSGLHDQLSQLSQQLSNKEQELRYQQLLVSQAQQLQQAQAQVLSNQSRSASYTYLQNRPSPLNIHRSPPSTAVEETPSTAPLHQTYSFVSQPEASVPLTHSSSQSGETTKRSSPLPTPTPSHRRPAQRQGQPTSPGTAMRSQSQPARQTGLQNMVYASPYGMVAVPATSGRQDLSAARYYHPSFLGPFIAPFGGYYINTATAEPIQREYLGYGFGGSPQLAAQYPDPGVSQIPAFDDLQRVGRGPSRQSSRMSTSTTAPPASSRSPSPIQSDFDGGGNKIRSSRPRLYSGDAPSIRSMPEHNTGPMIVNGSYTPSTRTSSDDFSFTGLDQRPMDSSSHVHRPMAPMIVGSSSATGLYASTAVQQSPLGIQNLNGQTMSTFRASNPTSPTKSPHQDSDPSPISQPTAEPSQIVESQPQTPQNPTNSQSAKETPPQNSIRSSTANRGNGGSKHSITPLELSHGVSSRILDSARQGSGAMLSPVEETRTPSPSASRKHESKMEVKLTNSKLESKAEIGKQYMNGTTASAVNGAPAVSGVKEPSAPPTPTSSANGGQQNLNGTLRGENKLTITPSNAPVRSSAIISSTSNPWQQAGGKKNKNNRRGGSLDETRTTRGVVAAGGGFGFGAGSGAAGIERTPTNEAPRKGG